MVAVQFGSDALIWPAMLMATPALFSESSRQEYVADPIVTEWLYAALPCHHMAWSVVGCDAEIAGLMNDWF